MKKRTRSAVNSSLFPMRNVIKNYSCSHDAFASHSDNLWIRNHISQKKETEQNNR